MHPNLGAWLFTVIIYRFLNGQVKRPSYEFNIASLLALLATCIVKQSMMELIEIFLSEPPYLPTEAILIQLFPFLQLTLIHSCLFVASRQSI